MANKGQFKPGDARAGRRAGSANKATADVRKAIAAFAEANAPKLQTWLDAVAERARAADLFVRVLTTCRSFRNPTLHSRFPRNLKNDPGCVRAASGANGIVRCRTPRRKTRCGPRGAGRQERRRSPISVIQMQWFVWPDIHLF